MTKMYNFILSLKNIVALLHLTVILPVMVPEPWFAMQQLQKQQQQAVSDLREPQRGVQRPGYLWRIHINLLHVLNPALSTHYWSHSLSRWWWWW